MSAVVRIQHKTLFGKVEKNIQANGYRYKWSKEILENKQKKKIDDVLATL